MTSKAEDRETHTISQSGEIERVHKYGASMPADYSFARINEFVHSEDAHYEDLQYLALGLATEIERLQKESPSLRAGRTSKIRTDSSTQKRTR